MEKEKTYNELVIEYGKTKIPYDELLLCREWREKRLQIIKRDKYICQNCKRKGVGNHYMPKLIYRKNTGYDVIMVPAEFQEEKVTKTFNQYGVNIEYDDIEPREVEINNPIYLHVHHKFYILSIHPWEYSNEDLITLCSECHKEIHSKSVIPVYSTVYDKNNLNLTPCHRCDGVGVFEEYRHINNGICFHCNGAKYEELINK